jgi:type IV secretory pathway component VirB8
MQVSLSSLPAMWTKNKRYQNRIEFMTKIKNSKKLFSFGHIKVTIKFE